MRYYYGLDDNSPDIGTTGTSCTMNAVSQGAHTFYVQAEDNDGQRSSSATCAFTVVPASDCAISPADLDFGILPVSGSGELTFTITNNGTGILAGSVTENCEQYSITNGAGAYSLNPGATHSVTVRYSPNVAGPHTCSIELGATGCAAVSCTGTAVDVDYDVSPTELDFGSIAVTQNSSLSFEISNNGTATLNGTISESAPHYRIVNGGGEFSMTPGGSHTVTVEFAPTVVGTHEGTIDLGLDAAGQVTCTGYGDGISGGVEFNDRMICADIQPWTLLSIDEDTYTYQLNDDCPEIEPGDLLVGSGGLRSTFGYLREVTEVISQTEDQIVLNTSLGSLNDGILSCDIEESFSLPFEPVGADGYLHDGAVIHGDSLIIEGFVLFDGEILVFEDPDVWFHLFAGLDRTYVVVPSPTLDFGLHIQNGELTEYRTLFQSEVTFGSDYTIIAEGALTWQLPETVLYSKTTYQTTWVWFIPVVHQITSSVTLTTSLAVLAEVNTSIKGMGVKQIADIGAQYIRPDWQNLNNAELVDLEPEIDLTAEARATLTPGIEFRVTDLLYAVAGPAAWLTPYVVGVASTHFGVDYCFDMGIGCNIGIGISGNEMLGLPGDLLEFEFPLLYEDVYHRCWPWPYPK